LKQSIILENLAIVRRGVYLAPDILKKSSTRISNTVGPSNFVFSISEEYIYSYDLYLWIASKSFLSLIPRSTASFTTLIALI